MAKMAWTIWKFPIEATDEQWITMPRGARILHVGVQRDVVCLWALVDTDGASSSMQKMIRVHGTGHPTDLPHGSESWKMGYIGTFMLGDGALVFHVFEGGYRLPGEEE
jgi:hypothetical protein